MERRAHLVRNHLEKEAPLTPLARFLSSPCDRELNLSSNKTNANAPKRVMKKEGMLSTDQTNLYESSSSLGSIGVLPHGILLDDSGIYNGLLVEGEGSYCTRFDNGDFDGEKRKKVVKVGGVKGVSFSSSTSSNNVNVVKGQWTAEEDSLLVKLVKQHGVRKWSQIAKNLVGRIGKQCRERWHNHLRPDIKKDTWSEEEEILLIEAHEKVGNRWAEIAKLIPGRSENSIKNHWNATKRRQNSKRKTKRKPSNNGANCSPSILQEYIRRKTQKENAMPTQFIQSDSSDPLQSIPVNDSSFSSMTQVDDCIEAMQNFYDDFLSFGDDHGQLMRMDELLPPPIEFSENDAYLSCLIDEGPFTSFDAFESDNFKFIADQDSSSCKKDMDLIEMISSSQSSCSQGSNSSRSFTCLQCKKGTI